MRRFALIPAFIAALASAGLAGGCQSTAPIGGQYDEARSYPNVTLSQPSLQKALGFQEPTVSTIENGLKHVTLPVRARSNETLHVQYRVLWFDKKGRPIEPKMSWRYTRLEPRQPETLTAGATSAEAADYDFQLRWARP